MVVNGETLKKLCPVLPFICEKIKDSKSGTSYGLGEAGYDVRIKQDIEFIQNDKVVVDGTLYDGHFTLASTLEEFFMPKDCVAIVHDKSTWARQGLSVFNTVIEPGWKGFLTLELNYCGFKGLHIPAGSGIAQVVFHKLVNNAAYDGKYQNQPDRPVESIWQRS